MLKEARIVMPYRGYAEQDHAKLRDQLVRTFGGFTETSGQGAWFSDGKTHTDLVRVYDIAIEAERDASWDLLFQVAMTAGRELNQEAVYIRYPDGHVEIASVEQEAPPQLDTTPRSMTGQPLGTKRLPQVGEVWRNRANALVAVLSQAAILDGGYNVVTLTKGEVARNPGHVYVVDLDGSIAGGSSGATRPGDLVSFATRFDS